MKFWFYSLLKAMQRFMVVTGNHTINIKKKCINNTKMKLKRTLKILNRVLDYRKRFLVLFFVIFVGRRGVIVRSHSPPPRTNTFQYIPTQLYRNAIRQIHWIATGLHYFVWSFESQPFKYEDVAWSPMNTTFHRTTINKKQNPHRISSPRNFNLGM